MRKTLLILIIVLAVFGFGGCAQQETPAQIAATTLPVYDFTSALCQNTGLTVTRLITEEVSCLHDYSLQTKQMRAIEGAQCVIISGGGLEDFLDGIMEGKPLIDASQGISLQCGHEHEHGDHNHENDPHYWLDPVNAKHMVRNLCQELTKLYPEHSDQFTRNETQLLEKLDALDRYAKESLENLSCRDLITFHDGFAYLAQAYDLHIMKAIEEESGSEASAAELIEIIGLVKAHRLPAIFTEKSGSTSSAGIIANETGVAIYSLDMAMSGESYFEAMYDNIDTLKEALG